MSDRLWSIAVDIPLNRVLTYLAPTSDQTIARGQRVKVPLGTRVSTGLVVNSNEADIEFDPAKIKRIIEVDQSVPPLNEAHLKWAEWLSQYYGFPLGQVAQLFFPPLERNDRTRGSRKKSPIPEISEKIIKKLSDEQQSVADAIISAEGFSTHFIFGVTGSGKTEIYLEAFDHALKNGKSGIFLVPEISLTPQLIRRFAERFPGLIATIHSQLTERERTEQWWSMIDGQKKILVGARSALFCPIPNLGLIVVDEEHESSYKQDEKLKYHGRDAAIMLAHRIGCSVVLGSATPSFESWKNVIDKRYLLHTLTSRFADRPKPKIEIVDMRNQARSDELPDWLSPQIKEGLSQTLENGFQAALFLNRRGYSPSVICKSCGDAPKCKDCDISLTLHGQKYLVCHYCNYTQSYSEDCAKCGGVSLPFGVGTEKIETDLAKIFPGARLARADKDEIQSRDDMEDLVNNMEKGEIDILIGTQMIAKGLDFPRLKFVGLVLADVGFNLPDLRATERSFQLITQMAGRAGRHVKDGEDPGRVIIQTLNPEHPSLKFAVSSDFDSFAKEEMKHREELNFPPYHRLAVIRIQGSDELKVQNHSEYLRSRTEKYLARHKMNHFEVLGPAPAPLTRLKRQYRYQILLKAKSASAIQRVCHMILFDSAQSQSSVKVSVDVDPLHLL